LQELVSRKVAEKSSGPIAVILEPTRELAMQVATQIEKFSSLKNVTVYGGDQNYRAGD
jgi:superfamily II DNA/RNA helicase